MFVNDRKIRICYNAEEERNAEIFLRKMKFSVLRR